MPRFGAVADADAAVALAAELGGPVAIKLSGPALRHKSEAGALALGLEGERRGPRRLRAPPLPARGGGRDASWSRRWSSGEAELIVAARRDGVVPALVVGLGGIWTEALDDVAIVPLPAEPRARRGGPARACAAAPLLTGGRGGAAARPRRRGDARLTPRRARSSIRASTWSRSTRRCWASRAASPSTPSPGAANRRRSARAARPSVRSRPRGPRGGSRRSPRSGRRRRRAAARSG